MEKKAVPGSLRACRYIKRYVLLKKKYIKRCFWRLCCAFLKEKSGHGQWCLWTAGAAQAGTRYREMEAQMDGDDESAILLKRSQRGSRWKGWAAGLSITKTKEKSGVDTQGGSDGKMWSILGALGGQPWHHPGIVSHFPSLCSGLISSPRACSQTCTHHLLAPASVWLLLAGHSRCHAE